MFYKFGLFFYLISAVGAVNCPENCAAWKDQCYCFYSDAITFIDAEAKCNSINNHLASIHDGFANNFLVQQATQILGNKVSELWIGATNSTPADWSWTDGTNFTFSEFVNKSMIFPYNCVVISLTTGMWAVRDCRDFHAYVCEINDASTVTTPSTPSPCPENWHYYDSLQYCYQIISNHNFYTGEQACLAENSHLASIQDVYEFQFISDLITFNTLWIGLYKNGTDWIWTDGTQTDYIPWSYNMPMDTGSDCVHMSFTVKRYQNSISCESNGFALCKHKAN